MSQNQKTTKSIQSMTGFSRVEKSENECQYTIEIKSVNGRFLDVRFKIPSHLSQIEHKLKSSIQNYIKRGSIEVFIYVKKNLGQLNKVLDEKKIDAFLKQVSEIAKKSNVQIQLNPTDLFRSEFMLENDEGKEVENHQKIEDIFKSALAGLLSSREEEGLKLKNVLDSHIVKFRLYVAQIAMEKDTYKNELEERLLKKLKEFKGALPIDEPRFMQEIIYYMEKMDIDEELDRIDSHLKKLDRVLLEGGEVGRQIDFLLQELVRETNTIGSKTFQNKTSENIVQMKVVLEKIREQGLNLE